MTRCYACKREFKDDGVKVEKVGQIYVAGCPHCGSEDIFTAQDIADGGTVYLDDVEWLEAEGVDLTNSQITVSDATTVSYAEYKKEWVA